MRGRATTGNYRKCEFLDVRCMTSTKPDTTCRYSIDCLALPEIEFQGTRKSEEIGRYRRLDTLMIWPDNAWSSARLSRRWW